MGGWLEEGFKAMLVDHDDYYADTIFAAVDGAGTDDATLVRVLCARKERMHSIALRYMTKCVVLVAAIPQSEASLKRVLA